MYTIRMHSDGVKNIVQTHPGIHKEVNPTKCPVRIRHRASLSFALK
jgi:hypothetical protein